VRKHSKRALFQSDIGFRESDIGFMTGALFLVDVKLFAGETANRIIRILTVSPGKPIGMCHILTLEG
jgi:hypothetical protein